MTTLAATTPPPPPQLWRIPLVRDTVSHEELDALAAWIQTHPRLTIGEKVREFETTWSRWLGVKDSVMVNSGSSANLALVYALLRQGVLKPGDKVVVPAVSWVTTVAPLIQLGLVPVLCDASLSNLGLDPEDLERCASMHNPRAVLLVHVLGIPCSMFEIERTCRRYGMTLIEDSCESVGSTYLRNKTGTFGLASTFSFYVGHHTSTIEGGMVSTNDPGLADTLRMIRSHGWNRDLRTETRSALQAKAGVDAFRALYTFYLPGFNLRPTEIQGFLGLGQMKKIDAVCQRRWENLKTYDRCLENKEWKLDISGLEFCSNFAYPVITEKIGQVVEALTTARIETRPLVCGSIARQPFWKELYPRSRSRDFPVANRIHDHGLYLPNNHDMTTEEVEEVCSVVNQALQVDRSFGNDPTETP